MTTPFVLSPDPASRGVASAAAAGVGRFAFAGLLGFLISAASMCGDAAAQPLPQIGLSAAFAQLHEEEGTYPHDPGNGDDFGTAIVAGDFNADGYDDLATGIPRNDCDPETLDCGSVQVRFGWQTGPLTALVVALDPAAPGAPDPADANDRYGAALGAGDFNGDGHDDLAVGIPGNTDHTGDLVFGAGAVQIHYGLPASEGNLQSVAEHHLHQELSGVPGEAWVTEYFGQALAVGDFNGDGHDDLAIGAPENDLSIHPVGNVIVAHGHIGGLVPFDGFEMRLGLEGLPDTPEAGEEFGYALAAGDFNGDGFDDLVVGVPNEDDVGAALVVYGSPFSLLFANHWYFSQIDLADIPEPGDRFAEALAAGDFNGDGFDDLAVGAPREDGGPGVDMGEIHVVYGSSGGLSPAGATNIWEDLLYGIGASEGFDNFGRSFAAGDFSGDGIDDLAIGVSGEDRERPNTGAVTVLLGRYLHPLLGGTVRSLYPIGQPSGSDYDPAGMIPDRTTGQPFWGTALAAGDFDGNGFSDLAIGAPGRDAPGMSSTGAVAVLYGQLFADGFEGGDLREWSGAAQ